MPSVSMLDQDRNVRTLDLQAPEPIATRLDLRVAIFSDAEPGRNGVGAYYRDLEEHLRARVTAVDLICPAAPGTERRRLLSFPMPGDRTQRIELPPLRVTAERFRKLRPDVVVITAPGPYGMRGLRLARRSGARIVVGFHTDFERLADLYWKRAFGRVSRRYVEGKQRKQFRYADVVVVNSREMIDIAGRSGAENVVLVGTPIAPELLRAPCDDRSGTLQDILFAGRLAPEKNIEALLEAAEQLPELRFSIAGDGPLREQVEQHARKLANLNYLGWQTREQMRETIDRSDMLVLPSSIESFGTVALEAMARGRNVLVSDRCGILDWSELRPAIFSMKPGESVAAAIDRIAHLAPSSRRDRSGAARQAAKDLVTWNTDQWLSLLPTDRS